MAETICFDTFHSRETRVKTVLITGGASGIGLATATRMARTMQVIIVDRDGARAAQGMPHVPEMDDATLGDVRQYLRTRAAAARAATLSTNGG